MKRKVIKQANQAYTITLPVDWARKNNLDRNPEIDLLVNEKNIIISTSNQVLGGNVKINLSGFKRRTIAVIINSLYAKGIDEIEVTSDEEISSIITSSLRYLNGYALVSHSGNKYVLKDIGGGNYQNLDEIFKRVFQMVLIFYDSAINDIFGKENEGLEDLDSRDLEVNKFCLFLERAINKMSYPNPIDGRTLFTFAFELEQIGDEIHRLWRTNIEKNPKKTQKLKEILELSKSCLEKSFDIYYQFSLEGFQQISLIRDRVRELAALTNKLDYHTARMLRYAVKIAEESVDISHLTLMKNLK